MTPETLRTAMTEWGVYFNRSVKDSLIDIYWKHVKDFSDRAMRVVQADVMRTEQFFPKLSVLLPLLQREDYRRDGVGPAVWQPSPEGLADGYGDWSERKLLLEAAGLPAVFMHLFCSTVGFENEVAFLRTLAGCKRYTADLVAGLRSVGETKQADVLERRMAGAFAKLAAAQESAKKRAGKAKEADPAADVDKGIAAVKSVFDGPPPF